MEAAERVAAGEKMKTRYKHINFEVGSVSDHPSFHCKNNRYGTVLGLVFYYERWNHYVFEGRAGCVFDTSCLADIIDFMKQL